MKRDSSVFMRGLSELFQLKVGDTIIDIDALFSVNRMEQFLAFVDAGNDNKAAVVKLAYSIHREACDNNISLTEDDFKRIRPEELERFAVFLYKQAVDPKKEPNDENAMSIFDMLYNESNKLSLQMTENALRLFAPFTKSHKRISKMKKTLSVVSRIESKIPQNLGIGINVVGDLASRASMQHSVFRIPKFDLAVPSPTSHNLFDLGSAIESSLSQARFHSEKLFGVQGFSDVGNTLSRFVNTMISPDLADVLQNTASKFESLASPLSDLFSAVSEQFFNPLRELWSALNFDEWHHSLLEKERKGIERILVDAKWFMFSADIAVGNFVLDVVKIVQNKRIKNYSKHIDAVVFKYITLETIGEIKRDWKFRSIPNQIKRILFEALDAYKRKNYAVTAIVLSNMWQGFVADLSDDDEFRVHKKTKEQFEAIARGVEASEVVVKFFNEFIWYACRSYDDVKEDVPGRNAIAHGWLLDTKYPSRKTALNAILFTHFLMDCYPYDSAA